MNMDEYSASSKTKVLVYGAPKTGKTALVGKLAEKYKLHWLDLENGVKTLLNPLMLAPQFRKNINIINVPDHRLYPVAIDTVRAILKGGMKRVCYMHGKVNCPLCAKDPAARWTEVDILKFGPEDVLVIDSLSQLASSALNRVCAKELMKPTGEDYKATWDDYAAQGALMQEVLSLIQVLDTNIVCISHEIESESVSGRAKIVPIAGTRNMSLTAAKYFDEVVYTAILNKKHKAYNSSTFDPTILTGGRYGVTLDTQSPEELSLLPLFQRKV